jgi:hypothetical protein
MHQAGTLSIVLLLSLLLGGCSSQPRTPGGVIIDDRGVNPDDYAADLGECAEYADQVRAGEKVAASTAGGAAVGGAVGAAYKNSSGSKGATAGAVAGAVRGIGNVSRERSMVVKNCLRHRGYIVLN